MADEDRTLVPGAGSPPREGERSSEPPVSRERARAAVRPGTGIGRYEVIRPLGQGGMGEVYLARDTRLGRLVALKLLRKVDAQQHARFFVEARATALFTHENIVALHDIAEHHGVPYMVLEYVQGRSLAAWFQDRAESNARHAGLPPARVAELMLPVARALCAAHEAGVVHRDLKLSNLMLSDGGIVKVLDFGIAKLVGEATPHAVPPSTHLGKAPPASALLTESDALLGTQAYMAPEQWGAGPVDGRTDLWAMGIMLYQLVTGQHPLAPLSPESLLSVALMDQPMPSVLEQAPDIGRLGAVIDRCLVKRIEDRLGSARELAAELEAIARPHAGGDGAGADAAPYAGLSALKESDAARFFGRDREAAQVVARLAEQPLLAIVGSSGAGKSSLVRAGVIPALKRSGDAWEAFILRPGPHPLSALAELLLQQAWQRSSSDAGGPPSSRVEPLLAAGDRDALARHLREAPGFLGVELRARARRRRERILLFVDQLEELVTLGAEDERGSFLDCLVGAADDVSAPLRVVVSVRQDFLDRIAGPRRQLAELMIRGAVLVGPMEREDLRLALVKPAEMLDHRFESEALVSEMLDALAGTAGALPLLQFTAAKLWEGRDRERRQVTWASYRAAGGVSGALASHADSVLSGMSHAERRWARVLLLRLVTPERTRAVVTQRELEDLGSAGPAGSGATAAELGRVLGRLVDARLLTVEGARRDESTVELVHESLIGSWPALSRWLDEEQDNAQFRARLYGAAKEWEASGRPEGLLWRGEAAEEARRWQKRLDHEAEAALGAREARFLAAVVALDERERRRRRQIVGAIIAGLCVVVLLVSGLAVRSNRARVLAEQSAASARNATRMAAARERQGDPTTVLALLREIEPGAAPRGWAEFVRWARGAGVAPVVLGHDVYVEAAAWSPDGKRIATGAWDKAVRVWNADGSGAPLVLRGHTALVCGVSWSPDGKRIASASWDGTARVWNADGTGEPIVFRGHADRVHTAAWSPDGRRIASASTDKTVRVWDADGKGEPLVLRGHDDQVHAAAWSPDGKRLVSGSEDKTVRVWDAGSGEQLVVLRGHTATVDGVDWSPDGKHLVSASNDKTVRVWNADGTGEPKVLRGHELIVNMATWSPDGKHIVSASYDKTVRVWNADGSGRPLVLRGHDERVYAAAWSPDGKHVASASWDRTVRVWDTGGAGRPILLEGHEDSVKAAAWSPDGKRIASASYDKTVRVWDAGGSGDPMVLRPDTVVYGVGWSPDGKRLVTAGWDKLVRVWDAERGDPLLVLRGHDDAVKTAAWSPDGKRIVSGSHDKTLRVWNADGSGGSVVLRGHEFLILEAAWSPDGQRIVSASLDKTVRVWNADGSGEPVVLRGHDEGVYGAAWSPDGKRVVSASWDKTVRVWNADGSGEPLVLRGHEALAMVRDRPFSPDGQRIASSSDDGTVRVWNADGTGEPLVFRVSNAPVNVASWAPDGERILVASSDGKVVVWSDLAPLSGADDAKLWTATSYCMPLDIRRRLLGFSDEQSRHDLEHCHDRVHEASARRARLAR